mmetsp:Transcript_23142/g.41705  ORF Transcript_23142/g.41705 Transcript_23142/m.41705 type:complete len:107 (-) Transcript_23142:216-536(-)
MDRSSTAKSKILRDYQLVIGLSTHSGDAADDYTTFGNVWATFGAKRNGNHARQARQTGIQTPKKLMAPLLQIKSPPLGGWKFEINITPRGSGTRCWGLASFQACFI